MPFREVSVPRGKSLWFELIPVIISYSDAKSIGARVSNIIKSCPAISNCNDDEEKQIEVGDILHCINGTSVKIESFAKISKLLKKAQDEQPPNDIHLKFFSAGANKREMKRHPSKVRLYL